MPFVTKQTWWMCHIGGRMCWPSTITIRSRNTCPTSQPEQLRTSPGELQSTRTFTGDKSVQWIVARTQKNLRKFITYKLHGYQTRVPNLHGRRTDLHLQFQSIGTYGARLRLPRSVRVLSRLLRPRWEAWMAIQETSTAQPNPHLPPGHPAAVSWLLSTFCSNKKTI